MYGKIQLANKQNWLDCEGKLLVLCINLFTTPAKLPAGALGRKYRSIQEEYVGPALKTVAGAQRTHPQTRQGAVPEHAVNLYEGACGSCRSSSVCQELAELLLKYRGVFSCGDDDMG